MDILFFAAQAQPYPNPLGDIKTVLDLIKAIAQAVFYFALPVGTLALIILGLQMVFSSGNPSKLQDTRKKFLWVLIGTALLVAASLLAQAIINYIQHPEANSFYQQHQKTTGLSADEWWSSVLDFAPRARLQGATVGQDTTGLPVELHYQELLKYPLYG